VGAAAQHGGRIVWKLETEGLLFDSFSAAVRLVSWFEAGRPGAYGLEFILSPDFFF
jgi:hypothetical protein